MVHKMGAWNCYLYTNYTNLNLICNIRMVRSRNLQVTWKREQCVQRHGSMRKIMAHLSKCKHDYAVWLMCNRPTGRMAGDEDRQGSDHDELCTACSRVWIHSIRSWVTHWRASSSEGSNMISCTFRDVQVSTTFDYKMRWQLPPIPKGNLS